MIVPWRVIYFLIFPQIALVIGVFTSGIGVRVRRFFGLVLRETVGQCDIFFPFESLN